MRRASASVSATTICRLTPIAPPPGNSGCGCSTPVPRLASASTYAAMFARDVGRAVGGEVQSAFAGPGRTGGVRRAVPHRRIRFLQRMQFAARHVVVIVERAVVRQPVVGQALDHAVERVDEDLARL